MSEPAPELPAAPPAAAPPLTVGAAARRLGVAPATLRTWERRYGIGPSEHTPGRHRRYSPVDLARLELMQHALVRGASPADAARYALTAPATEPGDRDGGIASLDEATEGAESEVSRRSRTGSAARGLGRAALALDGPVVAALLAESLEVDGVQVTWDEVVRPVLAAAAERWVHTGSGVEVEHLLSECALTVFGAYRQAALPPPGDARAVLLAAMPGELHTLPMVVLAAALARRGVVHSYLGADLPTEALLAAVRRTAPAAVVLWAQVGDTADAGVLDALPQTRPAARAFAAGPGWEEAELPPRAERLTSLGQAVASIGAAVLV